MGRKSVWGFSLLTFLLSGRVLVNIRDVSDRNQAHDGIKCELSGSERSELWAGWVRRYDSDAWWSLFSKQETLDPLEHLSCSYVNCFNGVFTHDLNLHAMDIQMTVMSLTRKADFTWLAILQTVKLSLENELRSHPIKTKLCARIRIAGNMVLSFHCFFFTIRTGGCVGNWSVMVVAANSKTMIWYYLDIRKQETHQHVWPR